MKAAPNPDRFFWGLGEWQLVSSPVHSAEEIKAFNDEQRALGLKAIAAAKAKTANEGPTDEQWAQLLGVDQVPE
jgi:hypothetical protein